MLSSLHGPLITSRFVIFVIRLVHSPIYFKPPPLLQHTFFTVKNLNTSSLPSSKKPSFCLSIHPGVHFFVKEPNIVVSYVEPSDHPAHLIILTMKPFLQKNFKNRRSSFQQWWAHVPPKSHIQEPVLIITLYQAVLPYLHNTNSRFKCQSEK